MLAVCLAMTAGLFALIVFQGFRTFWPVPVARGNHTGAVYLGEVRSEPFRPEPWSRGNRRTKASVPENGAGGD